MDAIKRAKLEAAGFTVSTVEQFLGLTPEENELVESLNLRVRAMPATSALRDASWHILSDRDRRSSGSGGS